MLLDMLPNVLIGSTSHPDLETWTLLNALLVLLNVQLYILPDVLIGTMPHPEPETQLHALLKVLLNMLPDVLPDLLLLSVLLKMLLKVQLKMLLKVLLKVLLKRHPVKYVIENFCIKYTCWPCKFYFLNTFSIYLNAANIIF